MTYSEYVLLSGDGWADASSPLAFSKCALLSGDGWTNASSPLALLPYSKHVLLSGDGRSYAISPLALLPNSMCVPLSAAGVAVAGQITNELVRQLLEQGGMYSLDKPIGDMRYITDTRCARHLCIAHQLLSHA